MIRSAAKLLTCLREDCRGAAAVEFAFIAPLMILIYFGMVEVCQVTIAERRTVRTASAIGDLIAQSGATITPGGSGGVDDILKMGEVLMKPFATGSNLKLCVAGISTSATGVTNVDWRRITNGASCPAKNTSVVIPAGLISNGQSLVMARASYSYTGISAKVIKAKPTFVRTYYLRPRKVATITCPTC